MGGKAFLDAANVSSAVKFQVNADGGHAEGRCVEGEVCDAAKGGNPGRNRICDQPVICPGANRRRRHMKTKLLVIAAGLLLAPASNALAYDVTSEPDATMTQEQKLGPNSRAYRTGNRIIVQKGPYYRRYAHHRYRR
jgi:hypothetical protein